LRSNLIDALLIILHVLIISRKIRPWKSENPYKHQPCSSLMAEVCV
jgi:hypothetical protein